MRLLLASVGIFIFIEYEASSLVLILNFAPLRNPPRDSSRKVLGQL